MIRKRIMNLAIVGLMIASALPVNNTSAYHAIEIPGSCTATHQLIFTEGIDLLYDASKKSAAHYFRAFQKDVCRGIFDVDKPGDPETTTNGRHFYSPDQGDSGGAVYLRSNWEEAVKAVSTDLPKAFYYFGRAIHFMQDATSPHHSNGAGYNPISDTNGHGQYESYISDSKRDYITNIVEDNSIKPIYIDAAKAYHKVTTTERVYIPFLRQWRYITTTTNVGLFGDYRDYIDYAAHESQPFYTYVNGRNNDGDNDYAYAADTLLKTAVRLSAGLMYEFWKKITGVTTKSVSTGNLKIIGYKMQVNSEWQDYKYKWVNGRFRKVTTDGSYGEFYVYAACKRSNGIWDYEASDDLLQTYTFYTVGTGTYSGYYYLDSANHQLSKSLRVKWTSGECSSGTDKLKVGLREDDGVGFETIISMEKKDIPSRQGVYTDSITDGAGNTFYFLIVRT